MKKHLLTTTAAGGLVALMAAPAAAQDTEFGFDGFARMGGTYDDSTEDFNTDYRFQLDASFKVVADAGLTFGGKSRMRIDDGATGDNGFNAPVLYVSTGDLKVSMGNISGVIFNAPSSFVGTGLTGNGSHGTAVYMDGFSNTKQVLGAAEVTTDSSGEATITYPDEKTAYKNPIAPLEYDSNGNGPTNGVQLDYAMAGISMSAMYTEDSSGISLGYSQDGLSIGAAYQQNDVTGADDTLMVGGVSYTMDALTVGAAYAVAEDKSEDEEGTKWSINGSYAFNDAVTAKAFFASEDNDGAGSGLGVDGESYGLSVSRTLGAGVTAVAGWEQDAADVNYISAGVTMNF